MTEKNSTLAYRWMQEVWTKGREEAIDEMMDENGTVHGIANLKTPGTVAFKQFFRDFRQQFPSIDIDVQEVISEGDLEACRCVVNATTASGQKVQFSGMTFTRISNGKIIEGWNNFDFLEMHQQLGSNLVPAGS
jgi:predicted ester cyclase